MIALLKKTVTFSNGTDLFYRLVKKLGVKLLQESILKNGLAMLDS